MKNKKVVLAYSGGLDTTCCVAWLQEQGYDVVCFSADLGSEFSPQRLKEKARASGVSRLYVSDLRKEFAYDYILPALQAGAVYEKKYLLATALGRPLIAKHLVDIAKKENASCIAHGCTAKGNDQVRFDIAVRTLAPDLKIIAPLREWHLTSRDSEIAYAKERKLPLSATKEKIYSIDKNIWGTSIEAGILEDLANAPRADSYIMTSSIEKAKARPQRVRIDFEKGVPVALNGEACDLVTMIERLNAIGGSHAIGRTDLVEDRTVGIKSREVYEAPAAWILHTAQRELENVVCDRQVLYFKELVALQYAQLVYQGLWFSHLKESLDAFTSSVQKYVSGQITLELHKGNIIVLKRVSRYSLYKLALATYGAKDAFQRSWAEGFINIWGMPFMR